MSTTDDQPSILGLSTLLEVAQCSGHVTLLYLGADGVSRLSVNVAGDSAQRLLEYLAALPVVARPPLTRRGEQLDFLCMDLSERFWRDFSALCDRYVDEGVARGLDRDEVTTYLGEKTSIRGRRR